MRYKKKLTVKMSCVLTLICISNRKIPTEKRMFA